MVKSFIIKVIILEVLPSLGHNRDTFSAGRALGEAPDLAKV
jgi:hypothetical protein